MDAAPLPDDHASARSARGHLRSAKTANTLSAYAKDWRHYSAWCRRRNLPALPPSPQVIGLYINACAAGDGGARALSVATIERRLSGLSWNVARRGHRLDRADPHIATALAGVRRRHARPPRRKEAILAGDLLTMLGTLPLDLRGLRDRAILLIGFAGGLRRSQIVGLDAGRDQTADGLGWIEIMSEGLVLTLRGKDGWREVGVGRGAAENSCPVAAVERWLKFARLTHGPLFRRIGRDGRSLAAGRLSDKHVARLVKQAALAAGLGADQAERADLFSGHSLRTGLAHSTAAGQQAAQKHPGPNPTKTAGR